MSSNFFLFLILFFSNATQGMETDLQQQQQRSFLSNSTHYFTLINALRDNNLEALKKMFENNKLTQNDKNELLCYAVGYGSHKAVKVVLNSGASAQTADLNQVGSHNSYNDESNSLISRVFTNSYGLTLLTERQQRRNKARIIKGLIKRGASLEKKDVIKRWEIREVFDEALKKTIEEGTMEEVGMTPLMQAIYFKNRSAVKRLLALKADIIATDSQGNSVSYYAERSSSKIRKVLESSQNK